MISLIMRAYKLQAAKLSLCKQYWSVNFDDVSYAKFSSNFNQSKKLIQTILND